MSYAVKELFFTLQGEGAQAGRAAVFVRFTGCNLWTGRDVDRERAVGSCARWCDTDFFGTDGSGGGRYSSAEELSAAVTALWPPGPRHRYVVCTGGEPTLQLDEELVSALRSNGFKVAVETNGTNDLAASVDWVCVSPKAGTTLKIRRGNELKFVFPQLGTSPKEFEELDFEHFFLQPMDGPARESNTRAAIDWVMANPRWRLCLQTHKYLGLR